MRKINGKAFLFLLVGVAALGAGFAALYFFQQRRIGESLRWQARRAEEQGDQARAARMLQRYLEFNPRDHAERATLARIWADESATPRQRTRALAELDKVLLADDDPALRKLAVKTAIGLRDFISARGHLKKLLREEEMATAIAAQREAWTKKVPLPDAMLRADPARGELESYWGQLLEEEKKPEEARACYALAMRHAPEIQASFVRLAYLLRRRAEPEALAEADAALDSLVANNASSHEAYLSRWRYRRDFGLIVLRENAGKGRLNLDDAADDVAQALKRKPDSIDALLAAADLERLRGRIAAEDSTRSAAQRLAGLKAHREKAFAHVNRGLEIVKARKAGAVDEASEFQLLWHKGNMLLDGLDIEPGKGDAPADGLAARKAEIEALADRVRKSGIVGASDYMNGRLALHERRWADAAARFERARTALAGQPDLASQADLYLGQCYERLEEPTQMHAAFKRVADWDPSSVQAQLGMAAADMLRGQFDGADKAFARLIRQGQVPPRVWFDIARLEIQRQARSEKPDWKAADSHLEQAARHNPAATTETALLRAEALFRQGKLADARKALEDARAGQDDEAELWTALAELSAHEKKPAEARAILDEARRKLGDKVPLRLALARLDGARADFSARAARREAFTEDEQSRLLGGLADIALRAGNAAGARAMWGEMARLPRHASDLRLHMLLFDVALSAGDEPGMRKALDNVGRIEQSSGTYHRYGKALVAIWRAKGAGDAEERTRQLEIAGRELEAVRQARPSWGALFLARSEVAELAGQPHEAIKDLQEAKKNGEASPAVIRRLISLLAQQGRDDEAQALLGEVSRLVAANAGLRDLQVAVHIRRGEMQKALEIARETIRDESRDPKDLVFLARVLSANGKHDEAERRLADAIRNAPTDAEAWLARVQFFVERRRKADAVAAIADAEKVLPPGKRALILAQCLDLVGDSAKSRPLYTAALEAGKGDPTVLRAVASAHLAAGRTPDAEPLLRRLAESNPSTRPADQEWARRTLAVVLCGGADFRRFAEALDLVGLKLDASGKLPAADGDNKPTDLLRAQARVLASQGQQQFRTRAISLFESLERKGTLSEDDRFLLAVLYEAEGQAERSQDRLRELARTPLRTPRYLAQYATSLIGRNRRPGDLEEAEKYIAILEDMEAQREVGPNGFASVDLRSRVLEARGKKDEAVALMRKHVDRKGARPEEVVLLAGVLGRQGRFTDALALCEKAWNDGKCPPEVLAGVSTSLLQVMSPTDAQVAAVEKRLRAAIEAKPAGTMLKLQLADLLDRRGQYPEAARLYREVLAKEPTNFVALNNLAWMLANGGGDAKEALTHIEKALAGTGRRADLLDTRGLVHLALKDTPKAISDLKEASAEGSSPQRLFHLARACHEGRDKDGARDALKRAKQAGLQVAKLHPVEQEAARKLLAEYGL